MTELTITYTIQDEILEFLLSSPTPKEITNFHASETAQERLRYLLEANRKGAITDSEMAELDEAAALNHVITLLKAKAHLILQTA